MDLNLLSKLLKDLLMFNDRVSLPGMGSFITEIAPSVFSDRALVIHPPFRRVLFRTTETWNDGLLEELYSKESSVSLDDAKTTIGKAVEGMREILNSKKVLALPEFGTMKATESGDLFFVLDKSVFIYPEVFGLEPINIKPLVKGGEVERITGRTKISKIGSVKRVSSNQRRGSANKLGNRKWLRVSLIVLFVLILVVVTAYVFRDQLRPLWEILLYSKEERALLNLS